VRKNFILDLFLYNKGIKGTASILLGQPWFLRNPVYQYFLKKRVEQVVEKYRETPFAIRIENTNVCNARCYMCPHSTMKRKQGFMSKKLYQKIIDQASELGVDFVNLHNFGEPLLDKDFVWRVEYAKQRGVAWVSTNTNGQVLNKKLSKQLIKAGLDEIFISLDAATKKTYQKIRIGLDFDKIVRNIKNLASLRKKMNKDNPKIIVDFLEFDLNRQETNTFIKKWQGIVDGVCISQIHDWSLKKKNLFKSKFANYVSFSQSPCRLPFTELLINWDGTACLCCQDIEGEVIVGDANKQSLKKIWQGRVLDKIRKKHLTLDVNDLPLCQDCKLRTFWWAF